MIVVHRLDYDMDKNPILVATVKGPLDACIGAKVEYNQELWEIIAVQFFTVPKNNPTIPKNKTYRDTRMPVNLIVRKVKGRETNYAP